MNRSPEENAQILRHRANEVMWSLFKKDFLDALKTGGASDDRLIPLFGAYLDEHRDEVERRLRNRKADGLTGREVAIALAEDMLPWVEKKIEETDKLQSNTLYA